MRRFLYCLIIALVVVSVYAFSSRVYSSDLANNNLVFAYSSHHNVKNEGTGNNVSTTFAELKWFPLTHPSAETSIEVPDFDRLALSPTGAYLAFKGTGPTGKIYIFSFSDHSLVILDLYQPTEELLYDAESILSGSLLWSPQGDRLAFTGQRNASVPNSDTQRADVYIYDVGQHILMNATQDESIIRNSIMPISWSPDGNWLLLKGAWSEFKDAQNYIRPKSETRALSRDGHTLISVAGGGETCRLQWSPDMHWLASETSCFEGFAGGSSGLLISPFNATPIAYYIGTPIMVDQIVNSIYVGFNGSQGITYQYGAPVWINANTLVAYRSIAPITQGLMTNADAAKYSSEGLITFNVSTLSEVAREGFRGGQEKLGNWFIYQADQDGVGIAYNPVIDKTITLPVEVISCPISYSIGIDTEGKFIAVLDACSNPAIRPERHALKIFNIGTTQEIAAREVSNDETLYPIGFIKLPLSQQ